MNTKELLRAVQAGEISLEHAEQEIRGARSGNAQPPKVNAADSTKETSSGFKPMTPAVVDCYEVEPGIALVTMQDRVNKNTFSYDLVVGLFETFESIQANPDYKVVILTGYDNYFASGGTKEGLLDIYEGKIKFTDHNIYSLAMDCKIPVIAAMQGHAVGAGWSMGMFCDLIVMSRESIYTSNYLKYGFTPGAGATLIFPEKIGISLTQEILYTGSAFYGSDLAAKGVPFAVLPRKEVLPYALQLAKTLAEAPRDTLIALKDLMVESIRGKLFAAYDKELQMHEKTFVNQPEVKERIHSLYGQPTTDQTRKSPGLTGTEGQELPDHPALARKSVKVSPETVHPVNDQAGSPSQTLGDPIAIIGMAGQFPKSKSPAEFWENIAQGRDCISEIPESRWSLDRYYDPDPQAMGKTYCKHIGALEDVDKFDPLFFGISPAEAVLMDPQQRLFLESCWACIEDSGQTPASLSGSRCGVFVGCGTGDYGQFMAMQGQEINAQFFTGGSSSILTARISYALNLKGPCLAIDTACSSSLVAIAEACDSLVLRNSDLALAGGVYIMAGPYMHIQGSKSGMLSPEGRCYSFDERANGFVPAEGVGVVLLKRLSDAVRDRDPIHGVIRGWGVNQDGKTNGITAPSAKSQVRLEKDVYQRFRINPETITLVEAHATGTKLGDSIEVEALTETFQSFTQKEQYCALGTVKSNIGHAMPASGIAGVIKILLALQHRMLPPTINYEKLSGYIILDEHNPFYINHRLQPWESLPGVPRRAAVSAFGFNGTNGHLVIEEYIPEAEVATPSVIDPANPLLFVLSAKSAEQLKTYAQSLKKNIESHAQLNLRDLAYTLQAGREAMEHRMAFLADSRERLIQILDDFIGNPAAEVLTGQVRKGNQKKSMKRDAPSQTLLQTWIQQKELSKVAETWVNGQTVDWDQLYANSRPRRISIPTYPFARNRYWAIKEAHQASGDIAESAAGASAGSATVTHDLAQGESFAKEQLDTPFPTQDSVEFLQETLMTSLAQILYKERGDIDVDASFTDMGMDSMIMVNWIQILNNRFSTEIAVAKAYDYPTVSEFAQFMQDELSRQKNRLERKKLKSWPQFPELIYLNPGSEGRPVFWIHPAQGGVEIYQAVARNTQRPFYGIQARGWMTNRAPLNGIQAMAAYYVQIIQSVQPEGPYDVGGMSMGGILAYEITRQLQELGQTVNTIVMLDAIDPAVLSNSHESIQGWSLQTVNIALLTAIRQEPEKIAQTLIHHDAVDANLDDQAYLDQLLELAEQRGLVKSKEQVYAQFQQNIKVRSAYADGYSILPLPDPNAVTCHFFRNSSGMFLGELEPYFAAKQDQFLFDHVNYWEGWRRQLPNFNMMDVDSSNHMTLLIDPGPLETIVAFCEKLYV